MATPAGSERPVGVGLIGLGTIGTGVAKVLRQNAAVIEQRLGAPLRLVRIADLDTETDRGVDLSGIRFDSDSAGLIAAVPSSRVAARWTSSTVAASFTTGGTPWT